MGWKIALRACGRMVWCAPSVLGNRGKREGTWNEGIANTLSQPKEGEEETGALIEVSSGRTVARDGQYCYRERRMKEGTPVRRVEQNCWCCKQEMFYGAGARRTETRVRPRVGVVA
jgi:hypothetical protein